MLCGAHDKFAAASGRLSSTASPWLIAKAGEIGKRAGIFENRCTDGILHGDIAASALAKPRSSRCWEMTTSQ